MKKVLFVLLTCLTFCGCAANSAKVEEEPPIRDVAEITSQLKTYNEEQGGSKCLVQEFDADLNGNGVNENVKVYLEENHLFIDDPDDFVYSWINVVVSGENQTEPARYDLYGENVRASIHFDYFDGEGENAFLAFHIEEDGPSGDPTTHTFWYDGNEINYMNVRGFITSYDGKGNIYTSYNYLMTDEPRLLYSSYVFGVGLVPYDKVELVGKEISFPQGYPLVNKPNYIVAQIMGSYYSECKEMIIDELGENFAAFLEVGEKAEIVDFYCETNGAEDNVYLTEPWLLLKTTDGKTGWIRLVSGD